MKYAIISDIHGNLEALESVLEDIERQRVDAILCLGDIIGYGPNPNECVSIIKRMAQISLAGNHDYAPLGKIDITYFNQWARNAIHWTAGRLTPASVEFLLSLPLIKKLNNFTIVHATPEDPEEWDYITTVDDAIKNFPAFDGQVCFIGHSHVPLVVAMNDRQEFRIIRDNPFIFREDERYIINVGSVGQPRDLNPKAAYAIFDSEEKRYELKRIPYNFKKTQSKIIEAGLPEFLALRLERGQ